MKIIACLLAVLLLPIALADEVATTAEVMAGLSDADWRQPDPDNLLIMRVPQGSIVMELAPSMAPNTVANIKRLVRSGYYDDLAIIRSQDNYVAQWADPATDEDAARELGDALQSIPPEFERNADDVVLHSVASRDAYAERVGFVDGFPAASNGNKTWLTHCYGMLGVARSTEPDSGNGSSLYVVTGHAPRHLDRNITLVGRVLSGIELLSTLPRGTGPLGFYEDASNATPILTVEIDDDRPKNERQGLRVLRTDTRAFARYVASRTYRYEDWFVEPTGRIEICNLSPPVEQQGL